MIDEHGIARNVRTYGARYMFTRMPPPELVPDGDFYTLLFHDSRDVALYFNESIETTKEMLGRDSGFRDYWEFRIIHTPPLTWYTQEMFEQGLSSDQFMSLEKPVRTMFTDWERP